MPNVIGLSAKDAVYLIEKSGMSTVIRGSGKVIGQFPYAGTQIIHGGTSHLELK